MLDICYKNYVDEIQVGIDEAGRGCLLGPVVVSAVIWNPEIPVLNIKDSKKLSKKKRDEMRLYIENNALCYSVAFINNEIIDNINILKATMKGMHQCLDDLTNIFDINRILVDGNCFKKYNDISHHCIISGDDKYVSIAAASILAKTHHDEFIDNICNNNPILHEKYNLKQNMGYGTRNHINGIKSNGLSEYHRKTFCKKYYNII